MHESKCQTRTTSLGCGCSGPVIHEKSGNPTMATFPPPEWMKDPLHPSLLRICRTGSCNANIARLRIPSSFTTDVDIVTALMLNGAVLKPALVVADSTVSWISSMKVVQGTSVLRSVLGNWRGVVLIAVWKPGRTSRFAWSENGSSGRLVCIVGQREDVRGCSKAGRRRGYSRR